VCNRSLPAGVLPAGVLPAEKLQYLFDGGAAWAVVQWVQWLHLPETPCNPACLGTEVSWSVVQWVQWLYLPETP
jgi:hypothetical protein